MAKRVTKIVTCDHCAHDQLPERDAIESMIIKFGRTPPRQVDLCEDHAAEWTKIKTIVLTRGHQL